MGTVVYRTSDDKGGRKAPPDDLKVTVKERCMVYPAEETERKNMYLPNIDQVLNFDVQTVHFFEGKEEFPVDVVVEKLKQGLRKVLVHYDYLAGRLKMNEEVGRLEIDCNAAGAGFLVASSDYSLSDLGDLVFPNPAFRHLVYDMDNDDHPLCIFQVTTFKCGGFAIGMSTNHTTFDGLSFKLFLENLASQVADKPIISPPLNDRRLLAARSPPRVTFPHPELLKLKLPAGKEDQLLPPVFDAQDQDLDFRIFRLSLADINSLKNKAKADANIQQSNRVKITGFNVVTAHLWRCKALSSSPDDKERLSTVLYAVDIRSRLNPPLAKSYTGNAVLTAYATAPCKDLEEEPFSRLVEMVWEGAARMTDEYARSAIDWGEINKGFPHGEFLVSSWWRLGFDQVEYPWGKPRYSCPVVYHRKDIILLFPDINTDNNQSDGSGERSDGVNILVALPTKEMDLFKTLFHKFHA
ncbi:Omega-hydroxypalmitate O-feruloyl transferase [Bertholletia excelsa]